MRLRKVQGKLKVEHSILAGVRALLERFLQQAPDIRAIIPGVIRPVRDAKGPPRIRVTVPTTNGWKAIALSDGARQELFISTSLSKEDLEARIRAAAWAWSAIFLSCAARGSQASGGAGALARFRLLLERGHVGGHLLACFAADHQWHQYLAAAVAGDHGAFEQLTMPYRRELLVHCYRLLGSLEDAEDVLQETWLRAWRRTSNSRRKASRRGW